LPVLIKLQIKKRSTPVVVISPILVSASFEFRVRKYSLNLVRLEKF